MRTLTLGWRGKVETATGFVKDLQECCGLAKDSDIPDLLRPSLAPRSQGSSVTSWSHPHLPPLPLA